MACALSLYETCRRAGEWSAGR